MDLNLGVHVDVAGQIWAATVLQVVESHVRVLSACILEQDRLAVRQSDWDLVADILRLTLVAAGAVGGRVLAAEMVAADDQIAAAAAIGRASLVAEREDEVATGDGGQVCGGRRVDTLDERVVRLEDETDVDGVENNYDEGVDKTIAKKHAHKVGSRGVAVLVHDLDRANGHKNGGGDLVGKNDDPERDEEAGTGGIARTRVANDGRRLDGGSNIGEEHGKDSGPVKNQVGCQPEIAVPHGPCINEPGLTVSSRPSLSHRTSARTHKLATREQSRSS